MSDTVEGSLNQSKQKPTNGKDSLSEKEDQTSTVKYSLEDTDLSTKPNPPYSSMSPIVIRSVVECDKEEKAASLGSNFKNNCNLKPQRVSKSKSSQALKTLKSLSKFSDSRPLQEE
ncbi:hypothetical protein QVD17_30719 [Tagetes erecta]|uniref:Uncharacterized protein n=1 Tax=Tagetes erecta TaxID=13708 RepID=A0AAD8K452_TARER|nr:hypothetical protein QVD17_30719 [Tagetes erecta]